MGLGTAAVTVAVARRVLPGDAVAQVLPMVEPGAGLAIAGLAALSLAAHP